MHTRRIEPLRCLGECLPQKGQRLPGRLRRGAIFALLVLESRAAAPREALSSLLRIEDDLDLVVDEHSYSAKLRGRQLDLTFKEFELLKFLAQHPGRVFTRAVLLQEVWGYDYFGGTRTVDVHVRRLRAKLGTEHEALIGTVRNVGYRFVPEGTDAVTRATLTDDAQCF